MTTLKPQPPFVWPEPRVFADMLCTYESQPPFGKLAGTSQSVFGIVSALTAQGVEVLESWLGQYSTLKANLIVMVYPACATRQADLARLLQVVNGASDQLSVRIYPLEEITDRATNALCFRAQDSDVVHIVTGPNENFGLEPWHKGQANFVFRADEILVDAFTNHFDWLWASSRDITARGVTQIPALVLPVGTEAGARLWQEYLDHGLRGTLFAEAQSTSANIDPGTGNVAILSGDGMEIQSPTEALGFQKLDALAETMARLYEKGVLVSIDKLSKVPPLDAPLDPNLFGDPSELHSGSVTRKVSMRVSVIDGKTLKEIDKCRQGLRALLTKFTFGLADNMRWMPSTAREMFESELKSVDEEGRKLISDLLHGDIDAFIGGRRTALAGDIKAMYAELGRVGEVPEYVINQVVKDLRERLSKAETASFMPKLSYSQVRFARMENNLVSPWGQAHSLLSDIAIFPRKVLTDNFFLRGVRVSVDDLIKAMDVADDALCHGFRSRGIEQRCRIELAFLSEIELASIESRDRCELVWQILRGESHDAIHKALKEKEKPPKPEKS